MGKRLDIVLTEKYEVKSRTKAQQLISDGLVFVNGNAVSKPSFGTLGSILLPLEKV